MKLYKKARVKVLNINTERHDMEPQHKRKYKYIPPHKKRKTLDMRKYTTVGATLGVTAIIIVLLLIGYFMVAKGPVNEEENTKTQIEENKTISNETSNKTVSIPEFDKYIKATSSGNVSMCLNISNNATKEMCLENLSSNSIEACKLLQNATKKMKCITKLAKEKNILALCNYIDGEKQDECKKSVNACYGLNGTAFRTCMAKEHDNIDMCEDDKECMIKYVSYKNNSEYCEAFGNEPTIMACKGYLSGSDKCKDIENKGNKEFCYRKLAEFTKQSDYCSYIKKDTYHYNQCYYKIALDTGKYELCEKIDLAYKWDCYKDYAEKYKDPKGCMKIHPMATNAYNNCFINTSIATHNASLCTYLPGYLIEKCYASAIYNDPTYIYPKENCEGILNKAWKNACYTELAIRTKNKTYCNYIGDDAPRDRCISLAED